MDRIDPSRALNVGLIADTHGLVRPGVHRALAGVDLILHAGDVGGDDILAELALIAPILAVAGNTDPPGDPRLPESIVRTLGGVDVHVSHGHEVGKLTPPALLARYTQRVIVFGHTHRALVHQDGERWAINPGAAGPRRFDLVPSVGRLRLDGGMVTVEIVPVED